MDRAARQALMAVIQEQQSSGGEVAVPLELFFTGNDDLGSIGCNLGADRPDIEEFYQVLRRLRDRPDVQDVLVRITDAEDDTSWPFSDAVYVVTSMAHEDLEDELAGLQYDEVQAGWMYGVPHAAAAAKPGFVPFSTWWD